ncbi:MAG: hypothetical protein ACI4SG_09500 [Oligosphaeraceae bacterium]
MKIKGSFVFLALLLILATAGFHADLLELLRRRFTQAPPEIALVFPGQGCLPLEEPILRFNICQMKTPRGENPFDDYRLQTSLTDAKGNFHQETLEWQGHTATWHLPQIPPGKFTLTAMLLEKGKEDQGPLQTLQRQMTALPPQPPAPGETRLDSLGRTLVDGAPFLPIGLFISHFHDENDLELFLDSDFNCFMPYDSAGLRLPGAAAGALPPLESAKAVMDVLQPHGKKIIFSLKGLHDIPFTQEEGRSFQRNFGGANFAETTRRIVTALREHPALLAWYINDEVPMKDLKSVEERRLQVNQLDPRHPTWGVLCDYAEAPFFAAAQDVMGVDPYPILRKSPADQKRCVEAMDAVERSGQPCWSVPQIFTHGIYKARKDPEVYPRFLVPTLEQERGLVLYQAIRGAKGFILYSFKDLKRPYQEEYLKPFGGTREEFLRRWEETKTLATLLKELAPWILSDTPPQLLPLETQDGEAAAALFTDTQGTPMVLLANIGPEDPQGTLVLPENLPPMKARYGHAVETTPGTWRFSGEDVWGELLLPQ